MYAVRYGERRFRVFEDYLAATRFFSAQPASPGFQIQLWKLLEGGWESLAWTPVAGSRAEVSSPMDPR